MHFKTHNPSKFILTLAVGVVASLLLFWALASGSNVVPAHAQIPDTPTPESTSEQGEESGVLNLSSLEGKLNPPKYPNLDSNLNQIVQQVETGQFTAQAAAANTHLHRDETVAVTVYVVEGYVEDIVEYLKDNDASPRNIGGDYIEAYVPVSLLAEASEQEGVISIRTIVPAQPAQGTVVSGSVTVHGATAWHSAGYKGQGVKVGVIDIGNGGFSGFSSLMGSELPASVEARCYTDIGQFTFNLSDCETGGYSHGTAVVEAVFGIAPSATYYVTNPITPGDLATAVDWMIEHDVDVINHSVGWLWDGPGDGTSPYDGTIPHPFDFEAPYWNSPLRTLNTAIEGGAIWINSAGNSATQTWYGTFADTDGDGFHNFSGNIECNELEVEGLLSFITAQLRWNDTWGGATRDVDLQLYEVLSSRELERVDSFFLIGGEDYQTGAAGHVPLEVLEYLLAPSGTYCLAVKSITGAAPEWIQLQIFSEQDLLDPTFSGSILNPAESANLGMLAVGAAHVGDTSTIEQFSSQGPTPDDRIKPDIVGADGVQSAAYGDAFNGTSQAAPHVAGLAALVQQRFPTYTPQQIANYLKSHASARGTVPNNIWGHGFARLLPSDVATATPEPTPEPTITPEPTATPEPTVTPEPTSIPMSHITPVVWESGGSGDSLSPSFDLSEGVVVVDVSYEGTSSSILGIDFLKTDGSDSHRVLYKFIPEGGYYFGAHAIDVYSEFAALSPDSYRIQINSGGTWHVDVSQPRRDTGIELPREVQGSGDGGSFPYSFRPGLVPILYEYSGPADGSGSIFGIQLYKMDGSEKERIVYDFVATSELPKSGLTSVRVHESSTGGITPGVYLLRVQSEGEWKIALGAESFTIPTPVFADGASTSRSVVVSAPSGTNVGDPVAASHPNNVDIIYSLSGADSALFTVDEETGQIRLGQGVSLVLGQTYTVTVTATAATGTEATIDVVIEVVFHQYDLNRSGVIEKSELREAIIHYIRGDIDKAQLRAVIILYISG